MRTEKEIKKKINYLKQGLKEFNGYLLASKTTKDKIIVNDLIKDYLIEKSVLEWVLTKSDILPF